jgi:hypothetical protein
MSSLDVLIKRKSSRKISDANRNDIAQDSGIVIISDKLPENAEKIPSFVKDGGTFKHKNNWKIQIRQWV